MNEPTTRHVTTPTSATCAHCGQPFTVDRRPGPTPRYCRRSCRQRAYEARAALAGTVAVTHELDAGLTSRGRAHALDPAYPDPRPDGTRARPSQRPFTPSALDPRIGGGACWMVAGAVVGLQGWRRRL